MADKLDDVYTLRKYDCGYCGYAFKQFVRKVESSPPTGYKGKDATSSQVRCPNCGNYAKTWDEGEEIDKFKADARPKKRQFEIDEKVR